MTLARSLYITWFLLVRTVRVISSRLAFKCGAERLGFMLFPRMDAKSQLRHELIKEELFSAVQRRS